MPSVYRPVGQNQLTAGDPYGGSSCAAYVGAMLVDFATLGGLTISGADFRRLSDEPVPDPGSPGLNLEQVCAVSRKLRVPLTNRTGATWEALDTALRAYRGVSLSVWYEALPERYRVQKSPPVGGHQVALTAVDATGRYLVWDPLRGGPVWIAASSLKTAAAAFTKRAGGAGIYFAVTRVVPLIAP